MKTTTKELRLTEVILQAEVQSLQNRIEKYELLDRERDAIRAMDRLHYVIDELARCRAIMIATEDVHSSALVESFLKDFVKRREGNELVQSFIL